jgi:Fe-S cluster assembly protein SufD
MSEVTEKYLKLYRDNIGKISGISSPYINSFRDKAFKKFSELGIPSKKNEAYKYANLNIFFDHEYSGYFLPVAADFRKAENFKCEVTDLDAYVLTLINGFYPAVNDKIKQLSDGVWIGSLNEAALKFPELIEEHYGKYAQNDDDGLVHLNTAMASDGVFFFFSAGVKVNKPVLVVNLVDAAEDTFTQHRNLIIVGDNAE